MPTSGTFKVPFRGKFGPYSEGRRIVPAFSVQSLQKDTLVTPPPELKKATRPRSAGVTTFRRSYDRGDFPLVLTHTARGCKLVWKVRKLFILIKMYIFLIILCTWNSICCSCILPFLGLVVRRKSKADPAVVVVWKFDRRQESFPFWALVPHH